MDYRALGYKQGYADGLAGKPRKHNPSLLDDLLNTEEMDKWEKGYDEGYDAGEEKREEE